MPISKISSTLYWLMALMLENAKMESVLPPSITQSRNSMARFLFSRKSSSKMRNTRLGSVSRYRITTL